MAAPKITEETPEVLNHKTWVFRASIHCEGCKRKVKKILSQVQGVYGVDIDIKQQKVTVTGNVEAHTLLKKLVKSGKNAELWPQQAIPNEKKPEYKFKNKEKQFDDHDQEVIIQPKANGDNNKETVKPQVVKIHEAEAAAVQDPHKKKIDSKRDHEVQENKAISKNGGSNEAAKVEGVADVIEVKLEGKKPATGPDGGNPPVKAETKGGEVDSTGVTESGTGRDGRKMKKKGQSGNNIEGETSNVRPTSMKSQNHYPGPPYGPMPANDGPPREQSYDQYQSPHGPHYYAPPHGSSPPVYGLSYNTTYPTTSYTAAYYAPQPPNSYAYSSNPTPGVQPQPSDVYSYQNQPADSFEMFSDENPNGCSVM